MKDRDAYIKEIKTKIDEWNKEIDKLAAKAAKAKAEAKKTADEQLALLKKNSKNYQKKYDELQKASGKAWDEIRDGLEEAGDALKDAFKKAKKHFD
jgi:predicted nuclease with TOPRIM domain